MVTVLTQALIMALFAVAYGLLAGQAGMLSFGHAAFFAVGAFTAVHIMRAVEAGSLYIPLPLVPVGAAITGFAVGIVAGFFATVRSGIYFAMITLALAELFYSIAPVFPQMFGGESGLSGSRYPWLWFNFYSEIENYYLVLFWVIVSVAILYLYMLTPLGRLTIALRENEKRVSFLGYNARLTRNLVFAVSSMFSAVAGCLWSMTLEYSNYSILALETSANVVLATFIGGATAFFGPMVGAFFLVGLQSVVSDYSRFWLLYQGLFFIAMMMYAPAGLLPLLQSRYRAWKGGEIDRTRAVLEAVAGLAGIVVLAFAIEGIGRGISSGDRGPLFWVSAAVLLLAVALGSARHFLSGSGTKVSATQFRAESHEHS
jgi:branched-chain amino acid transport system permease protein